jgi:hypothetical protein
MQQSVGRLCSLTVDSFHRNLVEKRVGLLLLLERLIEKLCGLFHAQFFRPRAEGAVTGDLISEGVSLC